MILTQQQKDRLMQDKVVQIRILVKENEELGFRSCSVTNYNTDKGRLKWQVGQNYAVQLGGEKWVTISADVSDEEFLKKLKEDSPRGVEQGLWYCPSCKKLRNEIPCAMNAVKKLHCINCLSGGS